MAAPQNIIAVIFDFDDTLTDDSTTRLLEAHKIDPTDFWQNRMVKLVSCGWDPTLAYLKLILDDAGEGKPLANVSNAALRAFGGTLEFYQGIPEVFGDLQRLVGQHHASRPAIEFYIISGGLEEIIRGSKIASHLTGIWGCRFAEEDGRIRHIMNTVPNATKIRPNPWSVKEL